MIRIAVNGSRSDRIEWDAAQGTPREKLPPLTPDQQKVAEQLHIREEDYQRVAFASRRTTDKLLKKTEWFAKILQKKLTEKSASTSVESVVLDTWAHKFEITVRTNGATLPLHVREDIVDELFDLGSENAGKRLASLLEESFLRLGVA